MPVPDLQSRPRTFGMQTLSSPRLDARFLELSVDEPAAARSVIANRYCTYRERGPTADAIAPIVLHSAVCGSVAVSTLTFGRDIEIEPDDLGSCLLVTTTTKGRAALVTDHACHGGGPGATVLSVASDRPRFHYDPDGEVLKVQLDHRRVSAACWRMMQRQGRAPLRFDTGMRDPNALRRWFMLLEFVVATLNDSAAALIDHLAPSLEEMLTITLLDTQPQAGVGGHRLQQLGAEAARHAAVRVVQRRQVLGEADQLLRSLGGCLRGQSRRQRARHQARRHQEAAQAALLRWLDRVRHRRSVGNARDWPAAMSGRECQ